MMGLSFIESIISFVKAPLTERPNAISAPFNASANVLCGVSTAWADFHWSKSFLLFEITPFLSHIITFFDGMPIAFNNSTQAIPAAPAPLTTILKFLISLPVIVRAFNKPAVATIAVPCWSSWNTGISSFSDNCCSIIKHAGAAISSRFIPPQDLPRYLTQFTNSSTSAVSTSISIPSISANLLNNTAFPSMTGFEASAPSLPKPSTAVPLEIIATMFPLAV